MCKYCESTRQILLQKDDLIAQTNFGWGDIKIPRSEASESSLVVYVDRDYLRLVDPDDDSCLDHGQKIKINYCPVCGRNLETKTSAEWILDSKYQILDVDGWDRSNFEWSFYEEQITKQEFESRLMASTIIKK